MKWNRMSGGEKKKMTTDEIGMVLFNEMKGIAEKLRKDIEIEEQATRSQWQRLCEQERLTASKEEQTAPQEDLLDYLRLWNPRDGEELFERLLAHPMEDVRFQVRGEISWQQCREAENFDDLLYYIVDWWDDIKEVEKEKNGPYKTLEEAMDDIRRNQIKCTGRKNTTLTFVEG